MPPWGAGRHQAASGVKTTANCSALLAQMHQPEDYFGRFAKVLAPSAAVRRRDQEWTQQAAVYLVNSTSVQERVRSHYGIEARIR